MTADEAAKQVFPNAPRSSSAGHNMATYNTIMAAAQSGQLSPAYVPGTKDCAASGKNVVAVALSDFAKGEAVAAPFFGPLAPFAELNAVIVGLFSKLLGHHAQAVKKEQSILCAAVPAANNYLSLIDQAVQSGQVTPQKGIDALNSLLSDFSSTVASIRHGADPTVSGECNAACVMATELHAIVLQKSSEYQDLMDGAAQTVSPSRPNVVKAGVSVPASSYASFYGQPAAPARSSSGDWLPIAAVVLAGFFFLRGGL